MRFAFAGVLAAGVLQVGPFCVPPQFESASCVESVGDSHFCVTLSHLRAPVALPSCVLGFFCCAACAFVRILHGPSESFRTSLAVRFDCGGLRFSVAAFARAKFAGLAFSSEANATENFAARVAGFIPDDPALVAQNFPLLDRKPHIARLEISTLL